MSAVSGSTKMTNIKTFKDGAIVLFIRADYKKPIWMCRIKLPGVQGFFWRSCSTVDEHEAYTFAEGFYHKMLVKSLGGEDLNARRISQALEVYAKRLEPYRARQSIHYKLLLVKRIVPLIGGKTFDQFDTALVAKLIRDLSLASRMGQLSANTIKRIQSDLKHFVHWCVEEGYLTKAPVFPKVPSAPSKRPHFDANDWKRLTRHLREFIKITNKAVLRDRLMLVNYVLILANTGIRVGEARTLKWRDLRMVDGHVILTVSGKTGPRDVVARTKDVKACFKQIYELRLCELRSEVEPNPVIDPAGLVFCHTDGTAICSFKRSFQTLLRKAKVETDTFGRSRTIYSLRHTYATFRLLEGVNHYALAKNMGTSVAMLEQYYGHTTNIASADELTKAKARPKASSAQNLKGKSGVFGWLG